MANRCMIKITKQNYGEEKQTLFEAESNSAFARKVLSGDPEILEAVKIFLGMLPVTYSKEAALQLMERAVNETFNER